MPKSKNAFERFLIIDYLLHNIGSGFYTQTELFNKVNSLLDDRALAHISLKTFQNDIKEMMYGEMHAPIIFGYFNRERTYKYYDPHYTINNNKSLNDQEKNILKEALSSLAMFEGRPNFEWLEQMKPLLNNDIDLSRINKVISYEDNPDLKNKDFLTEFYNYIVNKKVIDIVYRRFYSEPIVCSVSPYFLKQYNCRWFLIGKNKDYDNLQNFPFDRIISIKENKTLPYEDTDIDFDDYFYDIIGVTHFADKQIKEIILLASDDIYPYLETKPLHPTQTLIRNEERLKELRTYISNKDINGKILSLKVSLNYELVSHILSYGKDLIVLSPKELQEDILENIEQTNKNYSHLRK